MSSISHKIFYNYIMNIGEVIKELRIEKDLSQQKLAEAIGVSQKAIDYWERGIN